LIAGENYFDGTAFFLGSFFGFPLIFQALVGLLILLVNALAMIFRFFLPTNKSKRE
jgi:hypothetical protein